jgi:hypothetical protein
LLNNSGDWFRGGGCGLVPLGLWPRRAPGARGRQVVAELSGCGQKPTAPDSLGSR